jgi:hypothetical protein
MSYTSDNVIEAPLVIVLFSYSRAHLKEIQSQSVLFHLLLPRIIILADQFPKMPLLLPQIRISPFLHHAAPFT